MNKKELIETTFKEREDFINSLSDKRIYGWVCPIHNVVIGKDYSLCPLCEEEKSRLKEVLINKTQKEIMALDVKRKKNREYMRNKLKDPDKKKKHYEAVNKYYQKERARKKEHSLDR